MKKIVILFSGNGSNMEYLLQNLQNSHEIKVCATITNNPDAYGIQRSRKFGIEPIIVNHKDHPSREAFDAKLVETVKSFDAHLCVLAGFMRILTPVFTDSITAINLHPSYLPYFKGSDAMRRSYESDMSYGGVSVHEVTSKLDDGEVILQEKIEKKGLDFESYQSQARKLEKELLLKALFIKLSDHSS